MNADSLTATPSQIHSRVVKRGDSTSSRQPPGRKKRTVGERGTNTVWRRPRTSPIAEDHLKRKTKAGKNK